MMIIARLSELSFLRQSLVLLLLNYCLLQWEFSTVILPLSKGYQLKLQGIAALVVRCQTTPSAYFKTTACRHPCAQINKVSLQNVKSVQKKLVLLVGINKAICNMAVIKEDMRKNFMSMTGQCDYQEFLKFYEQCHRQAIIVDNLVLKKTNSDEHPLVYLNMTGYAQ